MSNCRGPAHGSPVVHRPMEVVGGQIEHRPQHRGEIDAEMRAGVDRFATHQRHVSTGCRRRSRIRRAAPVPSSSSRSRATRSPRRDDRTSPTADVSNTSPYRTSFDAKWCSRLGRRMPTSAAMSFNDVPLYPSFAKHVIASSRIWSRVVLLIDEGPIDPGHGWSAQRCPPRRRLAGTRVDAVAGGRGSAGVVGCCELPVEELVEERLDVVGPGVPVVEVVGVLPHVDGEQRLLAVLDRASRRWRC